LDFELTGDWDAVRWTNFFGLGNETKFISKDINYYRTRTEEWLGQAGLIRRIGHNTFRLNGFYRSVRVIDDEERFVSKNPSQFASNIFNTRRFAGGDLQYMFVDVNDSLVPTKGLAFWARGVYSQNINHTERAVQNYSSDLHLYIPLVPKLSFAIRAGAATVAGDPEFYQYASIGGSQSVRAFRRDRYWGKSAFYNSNELRYITKVKSYLFNGSLGLVTFYDNGRVWMPNENSNLWHTGYGGGVLICPFNKVLADITYGISKDEKLIQLRLSTSF
jgi:outer membrane translocation and assembly module TamA